MEYKDIVTTLEKNLNVEVVFKEYELGADKSKVEILSIEGVKLVTYIKENEVISFEDAKKWYPEFDPKSYITYPYIRLIVDPGEGYERTEIPIHLNKIYFEQELQKVDFKPIEEVRTWNQMY